LQPILGSKGSAAAAMVLALKKKKKRKDKKKKKESPASPGKGTFNSAGGESDLPTLNNPPTQQT